MTHIRTALASTLLVAPLVLVSSPALASTSYAGEVPLEFDARDEWRLSYNDYAPSDNRPDLHLEFVAPAISDYTEIDLASVSTLDLASGYIGKPLPLEQFEDLDSFELAEPPEQTRRYKADVAIEDGSILTIARPSSDCASQGKFMVEDRFIVFVDAETSDGDPVRIEVEARLQSYEREAIESFRASCDTEDVSYYEQQREERESPSAAPATDAEEATEAAPQPASADSPTDPASFVVPGLIGAVFGAGLTQLINTVFAIRRRNKKESDQ